MATNFLDKNLAELTEGLLGSYGQEKRTSRIGMVRLPTREQVVGLLEGLHQLLFPGYFVGQELTRHNIPYHAGNLLVQVSRELAEQIYGCLNFCHANEQVSVCRRKAQKKACAFLAKIPEIRAVLELDAQAFYDGDPAAKSLDEVIYCYPGYYAVTVYRLAHELCALKVPLMPRIMSEYAHSVTGADIHPAARIGKRFFIDHATGVVIGETTQIGDKVKIYQGVTLGAKSFPKDQRGRVIRNYKRHPTIEDNVTIYPNATILGGDTVIGKGVTVGGNVYITESVAAGCWVKQEDPKLQLLQKGRKKKDDLVRK